MTLRFLLVAFALAWTGAAAQDSPDIDPATGYRIQNDRAPVTEPVEGGRVDVAAVERLLARGAVLVDVMPQHGGYDPATGMWRLVDRRETIPGAT